MHTHTHVQEKAQGRNAHYKLTSTVMLWLQTIKEGSGKMNLGGSLTRQAEIDSAVSDSSPHIANIGRMVEVSGERGWREWECTVVGRNARKGRGTERGESKREKEREGRGGGEESEN